MSYGMGFALQQAVFGVLNTDQAVTALVRDASDGTGGGAEHRFMVLIVTYHAGFAPAKQVAAAVSDVLIGGQFALSRGHLVSLTFERAVARQVGAEARRQIEMRFKARVQDG